MTALVTVLLGLGVVLPSIALVMDVGSIYEESQELQSGADAAAMAVAQNCNQGKCALPADLLTQKTVATTSADANAKDGKATVTEICGHWGALPSCSTVTRASSACSSSAPAGNYVEVRVRTQTSDDKTLLPPMFARTMVGNGDYEGTTVTNCSRISSDQVCVSASAEKYQHTFNGSQGKATITADRPLCAGQEQIVSLVSYTAPSASFGLPQYVYDTDTKKITSTSRSLTFQVDVPDCFTQVDFVLGQVVNPLTTAAYGNNKIGSGNAPGNRSAGPPGWYNGGSKACVPKPSVTFAANCDKTTQVVLRNGGSANVDAVFTVTAGNTKTLYRVAKAGALPVKIAASTPNVTVEDSTFQSKTYTWSGAGRC